MERKGEPMNSPYRPCLTKDVEDLIDKAKPILNLKSNQIVNICIRKALPDMIDEAVELNKKISAAS